MPTTQEILGGLHSIVNKHYVLSIVWHILFYVLIAALIARWQPSNKLFALLICIPVLSVAVMAWLSGNPFNGAVFTVSVILLLIFGLKATDQSITYSQLPYLLAGIFMVLFGLVYPHFINPDSFLRYFYASPVGLIPCPTLSILIGFILIFNGLSSQSITLTLIVLGLFYGIFGVLKLAVYLDIFLVIGTGALIIKYLSSLRTSGI